MNPKLNLGNNGYFRGCSASPLSFFGYIVGFPKPNRNILRDSLVQLWESKGSSFFSSYDKGHFYVEFSTSLNRDRVLYNSPYWFNKSLLHLVPHAVDDDLYEAEQQFIPLWIQISGIPESCFSEEPIRNAISGIL
ncbi:uncharacterized protein LOC122072832 [Macadamia integrifolia]|uniref:uncharacterized protein LOC122072832 n=1 Tax=Macadamia integrifolia TaxID=60698 RepID=UPI001C4E751F|nr:uncharacterized protein LOC122072832 [Macadamia integrifolia]